MERYVRAEARTLQKMRASAFAPTQLGAKHVEEPCLAHTNQVDAVLGTPTAHPVSNAKLQGLLSVDSQESEIGNTFDTDNHVRIAADDHRTNGQQVRAYGSDHQSIHGGSENRPIG